MAKMNEGRAKALSYSVSIAAALAVGGLSALVNAGKMVNPEWIQPPLSPPAWLFPVVWSILFTLMGISAAKVYLSDCTGKSDALFIYGTQLVVNFLWTVFYFSFGALALSFFWLLFLIVLVLMMILRFGRCEASAGKLQIPYLIWLCFAAYLNFAAWMLKRG